MLFLMPTQYLVCFLLFLFTLILVDPNHLLFDLIQWSFQFSTLLLLSIFLTAYEIFSLVGMQSPMKTLITFGWVHMWSLHWTPHKCNLAQDPLEAFISLSPSLVWDLHWCLDKVHRLAGVPLLLFHLNLYIFTDKFSAGGMGQSTGSFMLFVSSKKIFPY